MPVVAPAFIESVWAWTEIWYVGWGIVNVIGNELDGEKFVLPGYIAVMLWLPIASVDVVKIAPPDDSVTVPSAVVPSRN